jgi:hypothetical protein
MTNVIKASLLLLIINVCGCIESRFQLSPESRLPKWFEIPNGMSRDDLTVTMTQYTFGDVVFELYDKNRFFNLKEVTGDARGGYPLSIKKAPSGFPPDHPMYVGYTVNGVKDIVEYRAPGPIFYMADDPNIWQEFNVNE